MLKYSINKLIVLALLCFSLIFTQNLIAQTRYYQYDGNLPFVKMMLSMMVAMGALERIPPNFINNNGSPLANRSTWGKPNWQNLSWGNNANSPYALEANPWSTRRQANGEGAPWNDKDSWNNSSWNQQAKPVRQTNTEQITAKPSPLAKLLPKQKAVAPATIKKNPWQIPVPHTSSNNAESKENDEKTKPCVTDTCGLSKPNIDGLWLSKTGEMLGINQQQFLWTDGRQRYLKGRLKLENEFITMQSDGKSKLMRLKYKLAGNYLLLMQSNRTKQEFMRTPNQRYDKSPYN